LFGSNPEEVHINPDNPLILFDHLLCACYELPFQSGGGYGKLSSNELKEFLDLFYKSGLLYKSGDKFFWMSNDFPASSVGLRNTSKNRYTLQTTSCPAKTIGEVDGESAYWMVHPQAIYLHEGENYLVSDLDIDNHIAFLEPINVDYYTKSRQESSVQILTIEEEIKVKGGSIGHGEISIITQVVGYSKIRWETHEKLSFHELTLPTVELFTTAYWIKLNKEFIDELRDKGLWNNDPINYGAEWHSKRDIAKQRDRFTCQICGLIETDIPHHVHHIKPFRAFTSPSDANALNNLTTLCHSCHKKAEANVRIRSGLAGLAYIFLHITPLYLMCDIRDIRIHQDPRSALNEGLPILVIYDSVPGGMGFSQYLYERHMDLIKTAYNLTIKCGCKDGCPSCVGPGGEFGSGGKNEALAILEYLSNNE
jgi:DEAD/DEAH box helicase domain-containing protein